MVKRMSASFKYLTLLWYKEVLTYMENIQNIIFKYFGSYRISQRGTTLTTTKPAVRKRTLIDERARETEVSGFPCAKCAC